jgi:putative heme-binding domain-containing protein
MPIRSYCFLILLVLMVSCDKKTDVGSVNPALDKLKLQDGFVAEHLYSPSEHKQGSWVAMTFDDRGRMITSDQYGQLYRVTLPAIGEQKELQIDSIFLESRVPGDSTRSILDIGFAHGLLYAFNSLYVVINHWPDSVMERGSGVYRLEDTNGNDYFDKVTLLKALEGNGEHGPHSLKVAPDGKSIYFVAGNFTRMPEMDSYRLPRNWQDDNLFPLIKDPRGHDNPPKLPAGWIAKFDPDGSHWELIAGGLRNTFDITFNHQGELFAYDSDMEWDLGLPWYRPTRIYHVPSGADFGWRTGTGKWPEYFSDVVPPILNIGQGSPTNFVSGMEAAFPDKYRQALYASDWSFGIIYAIHLTPSGATYTANAEEFLSGAPLPLTDGMFGPDGSFYFLTGGRTLQSDLYRVYHKDFLAKKPAPMPYDTVNVHEHLALRRKLEKLHIKQGKSAVDFSWPYLGHEDRLIRYSARIAIEHQPVDDWTSRFFTETNPTIKVNAAIAMAHYGKKSLRDNILKSLMAIEYSTAAPSLKIELLRALELIFLRMGVPGRKMTQKLVAYLGPHYPSAWNTENRFLAKLLVRLGDPGAIDKTLALMEQAKDSQEESTVTSSSDLILRNTQYGLDIANVLANLPPREQVYMAITLAESEGTWTKAQEDRYFTWFDRAFKYKGGNSYIGFLNGARVRRLDRVTKANRAHYDSISGGKLLAQNGVDLAGVPDPKGPWRIWTIESASAVIDSGLVKRDLQYGKDMFAAALCKSCHSMKGEGGSLGPELTQLGTRFSTKDMLTHIIEPDKEVSDQYSPHLFTLKSGKSLLAKLVNEDDSKFYISQNPFTPDVIMELPKGDVQSHRLSRISLMPAGLINQLNGEELKDLVAYLMSGGTETHEVYK